MDYTSLATRHRARINQADDAWDAARQHLAKRRTSKESRQCWASIADLRKALPSSQLPEIAQRDIRTALDELEAGLSSNEPAQAEANLAPVAAALQALTVQLATPKSDTTSLEDSLRKLSSTMRLGKEAVGEGVPSRSPGRQTSKE